MPDILKYNKDFLKTYRTSIFITLILIFSVTGFYYLSIQFIAQIHVYQAKQLFQEKSYDAAANHLKKAADYLPGDYTILKQLGNIYSKSGELALASKAESYVSLMQSSGDVYRKAFQLNPLDAEIAYALAQVELQLEQVYLYLYPRKKHTPYDPIPYFEKAVRLRPNGITYHYALARYLHKVVERSRNKEKSKLLEAVVYRLAKIYPAAYNYLKRESFWSPAVSLACQKGLKAAIREKTSVRDAHIMLSAIMAAEKDWKSAIRHYKQALRHKPFRNTLGNYLHLGNLCLKNKETAPAQDNFLNVLAMSRTREKHMERIYALYKNAGFSKEFQSFYEKAQYRFTFSSRMEILIARSLMDLKEYEQARKILTSLNKKNPIAEAYYWMARIAEAEKDWDSMELAIQKATVFDPKNSHYHLVFSQVLTRMGKIDSAERAASLAIRYQPSSPWLFNHRAWIRWRKKEYEAAVKDWESAIELKPNRSNFYAAVAEAYIKMGNASLATKYYETALNLSPNEQRYRERYVSLKKRLE